MQKNYSNIIKVANEKSRYFNFNMPIATLLDNPKKDWSLLTGKSGVRCASQMNIDWIKFPKEDYIFTHVTALSSVNVEDNGYYIKQACNGLVNANGNAWATAVLLATYHTFKGGFNFLEHNQIEELSKGIILDAIVRPVEHIGLNGQKELIYYCDLLVATERRHTDLVAKIQSGQLTTLSMGCSCAYCTCSKCGKVIGDGEENCEHIDNELLTTFKDENGIERIVSELCGRMINQNGIWIADPESVKFFEISWVANPAFKGAVVNHTIDFPDSMNKVASYDKEAIWNYSLESLRVADTYGMLALKVAKEELKRKRLNNIINEVAKEYLK